MVVALLAITANAVQDAHVRKSFAKPFLSDSQVEIALQEAGSVPEGLSLVKFRDETDKYGIRHQSFRQFYNGVEVESHVVIVHSRGGKITSITGSLLQTEIEPVTNRTPYATAARKIRGVRTTNSAVETKYILIDGEYKEVYKTISESNFEEVYIDVETGEVILRIPLVHGLSAISSTGSTVTGRGYTLYNGWQNMDTYLEDGTYYMLDTNRKIATYSAVGHPFDINSMLASAPDSIVSAAQAEVAAGNIARAQQILFGYCIPVYIGSCDLYTSDESDWYFSTLSSVTITAANSSWWYSAWDTKPDLYIKVYTPNGTCVYTSPTKDDVTLPVTFTIPNPIELESAGYVIKIYDEDATTDSYGGSVTISNPAQGTYSWSNSSYTSGSLVISPAASGLFDVHWGMQKTYDFYQNQFSRNSYDNQGSIIYNIVYPPYDATMFSKMPNNASAFSAAVPNFMFYGRGDGSIMNPVVTLDVMAHEFTHLVTGNNGNGGLDYVEESGALNESFSDIMAMGAYQSALGTCPWTIGAGVMINVAAMRSMSNPHLFSQPDYYLTDTYWSTIPTAIDTTGIVVHTNSGVQNHWFYLLSEGGKGVTGIGMTKALNIAYRNLIYYLAPNANHHDARTGSILAATDIYGASSAEVAAVKAAWDAVGVFDNLTSYTIRATVPSDWGSTIRAWVWEDGQTGSWETPSYSDGWYTYQQTGAYNIIFVNGTTWNGDNNQTVDIAVSSDMCIGIASNTSGKRTYTMVSCGGEEEISEYFILAKRSSGNYYFLTPNKVSGKDRLIAVDAGSSVRSGIDTINASTDYLWTVEESAQGVLLKSSSDQYLSCTAAKTATLASNGTELVARDNADGTVTFHYAASSTEERYLSLATSGNNYFVFYANENQFTHMLLMKKGSGTPTAIESANELPSANKVLRDGQVYIIRDGAMYNMMGQKIE